MTGTLIPLHEPDSEPERKTLPPGCGEPPFVCQGLEQAAVEIGYLREQSEWLVNATSRIADHFHIDLPPRPAPYPKTG
jgi:hypothetical protein